MDHKCHQEQRLANLESGMTGQNHDIQNLIKRLDSLTKGIWALVLTLIPAMMTFLGFVLYFILKNH